MHAFLQAFHLQITQRELIARQRVLGERVARAGVEREVGARPINRGYYRDVVGRVWPVFTSFFFFRRTHCPYSGHRDGHGAISRARHEGHGHFVRFVSGFGLFATEGISYLSAFIKPFPVPVPDFCDGPSSHVP